MDMRDSTGIAAGASDTLYITTDNGATWQKKVPSVAAPPYHAYFQFVQVISRDTLVAINNNNFTLYRSTDRGNTWTAVQNMALNNDKTFHFVTSSTGYMGNYGGIYKTTDGGTTWNKLTTGTIDILTLSFANASTGYAYSATGTSVMKTTDGGVTWASTHVAFDINSFCIVNTNLIYAVGVYSEFYKSADGGATWTNMQVGRNIYYGSVYFLNADKGFITGSGGVILSTKDGGSSWSQYGLTQNGITTLNFPDKLNGYASDFEHMFKTNDGGNTWQTTGLSVPNSSILQAWFPNKDTGVVVANNSLALRICITHDGGATWKITPMRTDLNSVGSMSFANDSVGYLWATENAINTSFMYTTKDGGNTWQHLDGQFPGLLKKIQFVTPAIGYGTTTHSVVRTVDSAKTWQVLDTEEEPFNGLYFMNAATGYAFGDNSQLVKTTDSGKTWSPIHLPYGHISGMRFVNDQIGYINLDTYNQGLWKTFDSGKTWHYELPIGVPWMAATPDSMMYVAGGGVLRQAVAEYNIDSLTILSILPCSARLSAEVSAAFSTVSNITLQYGTGSFTDSIALTPSSVTNGTIKVTAGLQNLLFNTSYIYRLKCVYKGNTVYSTQGIFTTSSLPKPVIFTRNDTLTSSSFSNNQWYLNGQAIPGATDWRLKATGSGNYTVQLVLGDCVSAMSDPVAMIITAVNTTASAPQISIFPNPVHGNLYITQPAGRLAEVQVSDLYGRKVYTARSSSATIVIPFTGVATGVYMITVTDMRNKTSITRKVVKE